MGDLMAKMIKFDLPIDGVKVATLDDLRDHFTHEIIGHFRSGLLERWLRSRSMAHELASVEALTTDDDAAVLKELCRIFEIEADDDALAAALAEATGVPGIHLHQSHSNSHEHAHSHSHELALWMVAVTSDLLKKDSLPFPLSSYNIYVFRKAPPSKSDTKEEWVSQLFRYIEHCHFVLGMLRGCPDKEWASDMSQHIQNCLDQSCSILGISGCSEDDLRYRYQAKESPRLKDELFQLIRESNLLTYPFRG